MKYPSNEKRRRIDRVWRIVEWTWTACIVVFSLFVIVMIVR